MKRTAWAPAHISAMFSPYLVDDPLRSGSTGAGFCLKKGAWAVVDVEEGSGEKSFFINGVRLDAEVSRTAVSFLEKRAGLSVEGDFQITLDYPMGQGFGMSAAGTLAVSLALAEILGLSKRIGCEAAHIAEVTHRGGLGDVVAEMTGGAVIRTSPGFPPAGEAARFGMVANGEDVGVVTAVTGDKVSTASVLGNDDMIERVMRAGETALTRLKLLLENNRYGGMSVLPAADFAGVCRGFAEDSRLITSSVRTALDLLDDSGIAPESSASMIMLGNAVFLLTEEGRVETLRKEVESVLLPVFPDVRTYADRICGKGAEIIERRESP